MCSGSEQNLRCGGTLTLYTWRQSYRDVSRHNGIPTPWCTHLHNIYVIHVTCYSGIPRFQPSIIVHVSPSVIGATQWLCTDTVGWLVGFYLMGAARGHCTTRMTHDTVYTGDTRTPWFWAGWLSGLAPCQCLDTSCDRPGRWLMANMPIYGASLCQSVPTLPTKPCPLHQWTLPIISIMKLSTMCKLHTYVSYFSSILHFITKCLSTKRIMETQLIIPYKLKIFFLSLNNFDYGSSTCHWTCPGKKTGRIS